MPIFFVHLCALSYENPRDNVFANLRDQWKLGDCMIACKESAVAFVWSIVEKKQAYCVVVLKGTSPLNLTEWLTDASVSMCQPEEIMKEKPNVLVHHGFYYALFKPKSNHWKNIMQQVQDTCDSIGGNKNIHLWITGHSLGAATATLVLARLLFHKEDIQAKRVILRGAYTFGCPRIGNKEWQKQMQTQMKNLNVKLFRVANANDIVTMIPIEDPIGGPRTFVHVGEEHYLSLRKSPSSGVNIWKRLLNLLYSVIAQACDFVKLLVFFLEEC